LDKIKNQYNSPLHRERFTGLNYIGTYFTSLELYKLKIKETTKKINIISSTYNEALCKVKTTVIVDMTS